VVTFTALSFYPPGYQLDRRLGEPQNRSRLRKQEKNCNDINCSILSSVTCHTCHWIFRVIERQYLARSESRCQEDCSFFIIGITLFSVHFHYTFPLQHLLSSLSVIHSHLFHLRSLLSSCFVSYLHNCASNIFMV
jgi:hypothetical protein